MSYCRVGKDSDVYAYHGFGEADRTIYVCCGCLLPESTALKQAFDEDGVGLGGPSFDTPGQLLEHLLQHRDAGHKVPETALTRLKAEAVQP